VVDINLSKAVRSNLSSLQSTANLMSKTSDRLSTGNKVNSALDNPTNFFTAASLNSRAGDLHNLMDSMANGIKTIEAADNGLSAITKNLESMQSTLRQARQDKSFETATYEIDATAIGTTTSKSISFSGGALSAPVSVELNPEVAVAAVATTLTGATGSGTFTATDAEATGASFNLEGGTGDADIAIANGASKADIRDAINDETANTGVTATLGTNGSLTLTDATGADISITAVANDVGTADNDEAVDSAELITHAFGATTSSTNGTVAGTERKALTVDQLVNSINNNDELKGKIRASNDNGALRIENQSTQELLTNGVNSSGKVDGADVADEDDRAAIGGNTVRSDLADQFNELRDQLDKLSDDASFNGINLLRGDKLTITFNETGTSSIDIQTKGEKAVDSSNLKLTTTLTAKDLDSDDSIDAFLDQVKGALNSVRSQSSEFGSNLSIVQNRQDFTKSMINTLETGAGNLTLADMNQEAANMMALQTRQSLAQSTLSMANQADQGVLQLLR
jgi:flagellin